MQIPKIRACHSEIGLSIEASLDGTNWQTVQLHKYQTRQAIPSVKAYSTCINPAQDEADYFAELDRRGIRYERVRAEQ